MTLIEKIRYVLDDRDSKRYEDDIIKAIIEEGIHTISTSLLSNFEYVKVKTDDEGYFKVPGCLLLVQVLGKNNCKIPLLYEDELDKDCNWREHKVSDISGLKGIVYGKSSPEIYRTYPIVESLVGLSSIEDVLLDTVQVQQTELSATLAQEQLVVEFIGTPLINGYPTLWDKALLYYTTGVLLRFDKDEQNRNFGNEQLLYFEKELEVLKGLSSRNFVKD